MGNVVNIADFQRSEEKPSEEEEGSLEYYAEKHDLADELFWEFAERTEHDHATLYFMWCNMVGVLLKTGWGHEMLHGQITTAFVENQKEEEEES